MITIDPTTDNIILTEMVLGEEVEVFHNCMSVYTGSASDTVNSLNIGVTVQKGVYQVVQPSKVYNYLHYDEECLLFEKFNRGLYYYWVALKLGESCPDQYTKLCTIWDEFQRELNRICHDCV